MNISGAFGLENYFSLEEIIELENNKNHGFTYIRPENYMKTENYNIMIEEIIKEFKLKEFDYSKSAYNTEKKYYSDSVIITMSGNSRDTAFNIYAKSEYDLNRIYRIFLIHSKEESESVVRAFFDSIFIKGNGLDKTTKLLTSADLKDVSDLYYPFLDTKLLFEQFCTGNENILILLGDAGIGKCLHGDEEIDIYVDEEMYELLNDG